MNDLEAIGKAKDAIGQLFHEQKITAAVGASALASMLLDVLVLQKELGDRHVSTEMARMARRLEQLAAVAPAEVRALAERLADGKLE